MSFKDYMAPCTNYPYKNVYAAYTGADWAIPEKPRSEIICDSCHKKCYAVFMEIFYNEVNTFNFCSKKCWSNINTG